MGDLDTREGGTRLRKVRHMSMPKGNIFINQLPRDAHVTEEGKPVTRYYVATVGGVRKLVSWEGRFSHDAQRTLDGMVKRTAKRLESLAKLVEGE